MPTEFHTYVDGDTITSADLNAVRTVVNALEARQQVIGQTFVEAPDGELETFSLATAYVPSTTAVWRQGIRLLRGVGYTEGPEDNEITFAAAPSTGDQLQIDYIEASEE